MKYFNGMGQEVTLEIEALQRGNAEKELEITSLKVLTVDSIVNDIRGQKAKVKSLDKQNRELKEQIDSLKRETEELKQMLAKQERQFTEKLEDAKKKAEAKKSVEPSGVIVEI